MRIEFHDVKVSNKIKLNSPDAFFDGVENDGDSDWEVSFKFDPLMVLLLLDPNQFSFDDRCTFAETLIAQIIPQCLKFSSDLMQDYTIKHGLSDKHVDDLRTKANELLSKLDMRFSYEN